MPGVLLGLVAAAMTAVQPDQAPPHWHEIPSTSRAAIQRHLGDIIKLPNGQLVDLWPLAERQRVFDRSTVAVPIYTIRTGGGMRQRVRTGTRTEIADTRATRAWKIRVPNQTLNPGDEGIPVVTAREGMSMEGYWRSGEIVAIFATPTFTENDPYTTSNAGPILREPVMDQLRSGQFRISIWSDRLAQRVPPNDPDFSAWSEGRSWGLAAFDDVRTLVRLSRHVTGDTFENGSRKVDIPRPFRGAGFVWWPNLYDLDRVGTVISAVDLRASRDDVVAAVWAEEFVIQTWELRARNGVDVWERDLLIDKASLQPQPGRRTTPPRQVAPGLTPPA